jgi:hypothetical protein
VQKTAGRRYDAAAKPRQMAFCAFRARLRKSPGTLPDLYVSND